MMAEAHVVFIRTNRSALRIPRLSRFSVRPLIALTDRWEHDRRESPGASTKRRYAQKLIHPGLRYPPRWASGVRLRPSPSRCVGSGRLRRFPEGERVPIFSRQASARVNRHPSLFGRTQCRTPAPYRKPFDTASSSSDGEAVSPPLHPETPGGAAQEQ